MKSHLQSYPCPLQINSFWNLGFLLGITIILQIITGIFLSLHYTSDLKLNMKSRENKKRKGFCGFFNDLFSVPSFYIFFEELVCVSIFCFSVFLKLIWNFICPMSCTKLYHAFCHLFYNLIIFFMSFSSSWFLFCCIPDLWIAFHWYFANSYFLRPREGNTNQSRAAQFIFVLPFLLSTFLFGISSFTFIFLLQFYSFITFTSQAISITMDILMTISCAIIIWSSKIRL